MNNSFKLDVTGEMQLLFSQLVEAEFKEDEAVIYVEELFPDYAGFFTKLFLKTAGWWHKDEEGIFLDAVSIAVSLLKADFPEPVILVVLQNLGSLICNPKIHNLGTVQANSTLQSAKKKLETETTIGKVRGAGGSLLRGVKFLADNPGILMFITVLLLFTLVWYIGLGSTVMGAFQGITGLGQKAVSFVLNEPSGPTKAGAFERYRLPEETPTPKTDGTTVQVSKDVSVFVPSEVDSSEEEVTTVSATSTKPVMSQEDIVLARHYAHNISALIAGGAYTEFETNTGFGQNDKDVGKGTSCRLGTYPSLEGEACMNGSLKILIDNIPLVNNPPAAVRVFQEGKSVEVSWRDALTQTLQARKIKGEENLRAFNILGTRQAISSVLGQEPDIFFLDKNLQLLKLLEEAGFALANGDGVNYGKKTTEADRILIEIAQTQSPSGLPYCHYLVEEAKLDCEAPEGKTNWKGPILSIGTGQ